MLVQYKGVLWDSGKEFDSHATAASALTPFSLPAGRQGLGAGPDRQEGRQPGALVIPPDLGYGDKPPSGSGIEKDSTLVFSVDILAKM